MPRGLDHIVHAVRDLDGAAQRYTELGFRVGARNRHPWGTDNRIVQLPGFFVELLAIAEPAVMVPPHTPGLGFATLTRDFLRDGEGLAMLAVESGDAVKDAEAFRQAGIAGFDPFRFERQGRSADGTPVTLGFALAFANHRASPGCGFFACEQLNPQSFWNPAFQVHRNGVCGLAGIVLVAQDPVHHGDFLAHLVGLPALAAPPNGIIVKTPRGCIEVIDPPAWCLRYGVEAPDPVRGLTIAAMRFFVPDLDVARTVLGRAPMATAAHARALVVPAQGAFGATLVLEAPVAG
jgi:hypothetical protein